MATKDRENENLKKVARHALEDLDFFRRLYEEPGDAVLAAHRAGKLDFPEDDLRSVVEGVEEIMARQDFPWSELEDAWRDHQMDREWDPDWVGGWRALDLGLDHRGH